MAYFVCISEAVQCKGKACCSSCHKYQMHCGQAVHSEADDLVERTCRLVEADLVEKRQITQAYKPSGLWSGQTLQSCGFESAWQRKYIAV